MGTTLYKNHVITADANWDKGTEKYASVVRVVWQEIDGKREVHSFTLDEQYPTFDEAYAIAFEEAIAWADRRLIRVGP
jgi:hypothetical protein